MDVFVPEAYISKWRDFKEILKESKVRVYHREHRFHRIVIQCFKGGVVFTHGEPEWRGYRQYYLLGEEVQVPDFKDVTQYTEREKMKEKWWKDKIDSVLPQLIQEYNLVEGYFTGLVTVLRGEE